MEVPRAWSPRGSVGLSLVELLVTLVVSSTLLVVAVPAITNLLSESRLRGAVDNFTAYLRHAMAESTKRSRSVSVVFSVAEGNAEWCYGMSEASSCNCAVAGSCVYDGVERVVASTDYRGVAVDVAVAQGRFSFQPRRNTVTAGHVTFIAANRKALRVVISGYGRIRSCSPSGEANLAGYPVC